MRWLRSAVSRFLLYTAVALLVAVAFGALYGVKLSTSYNATVPSAEVGAAVAVIMPASSSGVATVNVEGASQVLYLFLGTNPIQLLPEVHGLGLNITTIQGHRPEGWGNNRGGGPPGQPHIHRAGL